MPEAACAGMNAAHSAALAARQAEVERLIREANLDRQCAAEWDAFLTEFVEIVGGPGTTQENAADKLNASGTARDMAVEVTKRIVADRDTLRTALAGAREAMRELRAIIHDDLTHERQRDHAEAIARSDSILKGTP